MSQKPPAPNNTGRLRAEDRRGGIDQHLENQTKNNLLSKDDPEDTWDRKTPPTQNTRSLIIPLLAIILLGGAAILIKKQNTPSTSNAPSEKQLTFIETATTAEINSAVETTIRAFMDAQNNQERSQFIRGGIDQIPKMDEFYSRFSPGSLPSGFGKIIKHELAAFSGNNIINAVAVDQSGKHLLPFTLISERNGLKIEWETSFCYGKYHWAAFIQKKPNTPTQMRVYLKRLANEELIGFDSSKYDVFEISVPNQTKKLTTLVPKNTPLYHELKSKARDNFIHPMNLSLFWPQSEKNVQIDHIIHKYWTDPQFTFP